MSDVPADLVRAVFHATTVVNWQENLPFEDMPAEWMWPFDDELESWFDGLEDRRKQRALGNDTEEAPMMKNALVKR